MKAGFYPQLAVDGIRKNKRLYVPYLLTCAGMVMMFYTNSFLMRRRKKEFGLYNMLGMGKANLSWMLLWETAILFVLSMAGGLLGGIAFSKLAELCLTHILGGEVSYDLTVNGEALRNTLLIFISGSVLLCRLLQRNKNYYYRKNHFVSVSSMVYRMKRNGAGLASICILSTMVLVMMLGAASLFFGAEDSLRAWYPQDITVNVEYLPDDPEQGYTPEQDHLLWAQVESVINDFGVIPQNEKRYRRVTMTGLLRGGKLIVNPELVDSYGLNTYDDVCNVVFVPLADYNRCMGASETLTGNEVLLHCIRRSYDEPVITMADGTQWQVEEQVEAIIRNGALETDAMPTVYIVVPELEPVIDVLNAEMGEKYAHFYCRQRVNYGFDMEGSAKEKIALCEAIRPRLSDLNSSGEVRFYSSYAECREEQREDFYGTYGGIFFLGILLSIVFLLLVMAVSVLVFGLFHAIVYKVTSAVYLSIVSGTGDA